MHSQLSKISKIILEKRYKFDTPALLFRVHCQILQKIVGWVFFFKSRGAGLQFFHQQINRNYTVTITPFRILECCDCSPKKIYHRASNLLLTVEFQRDDGRFFLSVSMTNDSQVVRGSDFESGFCVLQNRLFYGAVYDKGV